MVVLAATKLFIALICAVAYSEAAVQSEAGPLVQVNFYGEALCPYCARFLDTVAARIYDNGVMNMTRFRYIPYGNAKETQDGVVCQHGPQECELNRILSCAMHLNSEQQVWFPFAKCLESPGPSKIHPLEPAEPCAQDASINYTAIQDCASGQMAVELQKKAAEETASLKPAHTYVPWITVNGIAIGGAFEQLQTFICASYLGDRPETCYGPPQIAVNSATHATLSQVLQQIDHRLNH
ncbi:hypothetical protein WJX77_010691 [Trebouxia sp. C0004]